MPNEKLTFNDLPEVVGKLCERIESLENALKDNFAKQVPVKENLHVPMTVEEVCSYLGISKSSFYYKAKHGGIPVLSQQASARVPPRSSEAPGFFFRSPAICPVRRDIRTDASPA